MTARSEPKGWSAMARIAMCAIPCILQTCFRPLASVYSPAALAGSLPLASTFYFSTCQCYARNPNCCERKEKAIAALFLRCLVCGRPFDRKSPQVVSARGGGKHLLGNPFSGFLLSPWFALPLHS